MSDQRPVRVGDMLYGYCGGYFGRDVYGDKRIEALGADWVVARGESGGVSFAACAPEELAEYRTPVEEAW